MVENSLRRNKATYLRNTLPQAPLDCVKAMGSPIVLTLCSSSVSRANELIWVGCVERHPVGPEPPKPGVRLQYSGVGDPISTAFALPELKVHRNLDAPNWFRPYIPATPFLPLLIHTLINSKQPSKCLQDS